MNNIIIYFIIYYFLYYLLFPFLFSLFFTAFFDRVSDDDMMLMFCRSSKEITKAKSPNLRVLQRKERRKVVRSVADAVSSAAAHMR